MELPVDFDSLCPQGGEGEERELMVLFDNVSQKDKTQLRKYHSPGVKARS